MFRYLMIFLNVAMIFYEIKKLFNPEEEAFYRNMTLEIREKKISGKEIVVPLGYYSYMFLNLGYMCFILCLIISFKLPLVLCGVVLLLFSHISKKIGIASKYDIQHIKIDSLFSIPILVISIILVTKL